MKRFLPFLAWWPEVRQGAWRADAAAGLTGAFVVLPQCIAFAALAGLPIQYGFYTAMLPTIVAALFGSSRHLVSGPSSTTSLIVFATVSPLFLAGSPDYIQAVLTLTFLAGLMQVALGAARMGVLTNLVSHTVVVGFTTGAGVLIIASQLAAFLGLTLPRQHSFGGTLRAVASHLPDTQPWTLAVGLATLLVALGLRRWMSRSPHMIVALVAGSAAAWALEHWGLGRLRLVGPLTVGLPPLSAPDFSPEDLRHLMPAALAVTLISTAEALSIGRSLSMRAERRFNPNQELIGQGLAKLAGAFFSAYASGGSFNRSGLNFESGARTPMSAILSTLFLVLILLAVAPLAAHLPYAAMAALLFLVGWGLVDAGRIRAILRTSREEGAILLVTLASTLLMDLASAILVGVIASLASFIWRTAQPQIEDVKPDQDPDSYHFDAHTGLPDCPQLKMLRVNGPLYFGSADKVGEAFAAVDEATPSQKHLLVMMRGVDYLDVAGAEVLAGEARRRRRLGGGLYFYRLNRQPAELLEAGGHLREIGPEAVFPVKERPVAALYPRLDPAVCAACAARIFAECRERLPDGSPRPAPG